MRTNIRPTTDGVRPPLAGRVLAAVATLLVLGGAASIYVSKSVAVVGIERSVADGTDRVAAGAPAAVDATDAAAFASRPLRQALLAAVAVRSGHGADQAWLAVLARMGWRSTLALKLMLTDRIAKANIAGSIDILDALLRRRQNFEEVAASVRAMEEQPDSFPYVVDMLARRPPWRHDYLLLVDQLKTERATMARYRVLETLRAGGQPAQRNEIAALLPFLVRFDHRQEAWRLWSSVAPRPLVSPLNDPDFTLASQAFNRDEATVPFEWEIATGQGFSAEPYVENGRTHLGISWDGRGLPLFARQVSSAIPGHYRLEVSTGDSPAAIMRALSFSFRCPDDTVVRFVRDDRAKAGTVSYHVEEALACRFPYLESHGALQSGGPALSLTIDGIRLVREP